MSDLAKPDIRTSGNDALRLLSYVRPYRGKLALGLVCLFVSGGVGLGAPTLIGRMMDAAFQSHDAALLNRYIVAVFGLYLLQALFSFFRAYLCQQVGERVVRDLRGQLYRHLLSQPIQFFAERRVGELTSRLGADVGVIQMITSISILELLRQGIIFVGGTCIVLYTNPRLTLVMFSGLPFIVLGSVLFGRYLRRMTSKVHDELAMANAILDESLVGIRVVQSFGREGYEAGRYMDSVERSVRLAIRRSMLQGGFIAFVILFIFSGLAMMLWYGGHMVIEGKLTAGGMVAFVMYTLVIAMAMSSLAEVYGNFQSARGATHRLFELLDTKPQIADLPNARPLRKVTGSVLLDQISFTYPGRPDRTLENITIQANSGEVIAVVGPSGAGKSTLVNLIPRFYDVESGSIKIDGQDIRELQIADLRNVIGIVPQETLLFSGTVQENIAYGKLDATEAEIMEASRAAHAHEFIMELPDGYQTLVGERGVKLSGGQRQRIAIARALLKDPAILILDEATSSLDSESERLVQDALERLMQGRTTFVIAHRLSTVRRADRIVVIDRGQIVEDGPHDELIEQAGLYKQLYQLQFQDRVASEEILN